MRFLIDETLYLEYTINMTLKTKNVPIKRWWDVWVALTALGAISVVAARLWATDWASDIYILVYLTFFAGLFGLALGYSRFSPLLSALFSTLYGIFTTGWLFGTTVDLEITWRERILYYLGWRLRVTIERFSQGETLYDPILFLTIMAVLLWILASSAAFLLIRTGAVWPALFPLGVTLLVIGHYDQNLPRNTRFLMTFIFLTLLIIGRMAFLRYREKWREKGIQTNTETNADLLKTLLIVAGGLLVFTWLIPISPGQVTLYSDLWETIKEPWDRLSDQVSDIFITENPTRQESASYFGNSMGLGNGNPASEETVFTVKTESDIPSLYRNYWRARSYDYYDEADWSSNSNLPETLLFPDSFNIPYPEWEGGRLASYTFAIEVNRMINLYTTGLPVNINRPVEAVTQPVSETEADLIALIADPILVSGETYQVETQISLPTEFALRSTSTAYPAWVERYLQLPTDFSPDIQALAADITGEYDNPYDKAYAITRWLRINIDYSRTIPPIPSGADPMEWFLFDGQTGFCNYYATAQVLMLRSLGIPARMAVGYAEGEYNSQTETFTVQKRDSHAWPEVYFEDYGWVVFEPTVSQPALILPAGRNPADEDSESAAPEDIPQMDDALDEPEVMDDENAGADMGDESPFFQLRGSRIIWTMLIFFLIGLLAVAIVLIRPTYFKIDIEPLPVLLESALVKRGKSVPNWLSRWSALARMSAPERAYRQMGQSIKIMGQPLNPAQTPAERAKTLNQLLPDADPFIQDIIGEYHLDKFSNHIINEERAKNAGRQVRKLALQTRIRQLLRI